MRFSAHIWFLLLTLLVCTGCLKPAERLHELFEDYHEYQLEINPFLATSEGNRQANQHLPDASVEALSENKMQNRRFLRHLDDISYIKLEKQDKVSYRLFERMLRESIEAHDLGHHELPLNGWWDYHATFAEQPNRMPFNNSTDYDNYLERLRAFPLYNEQHLERLRMGMERGWVRPKVVLENYIPTVEALITSAEDSRFMVPFKKFPSSINESEQEHYLNEATTIIRDIVMPEYQKIVRFLWDEYYVAAPEKIGVSELRGGRDYYSHLVRSYTTLDITPQEVHETGLREVARIREEMMFVIEETGFEGTFDEFVEFLRSDAQFYASTAEELLEYTAYILKKMDGELPRYFGKLPRAPYGLREVPDYLAPRMTTAYYNSPARDGTRAGFYYVNTYNLPSRPLYEVEALSFHEAVPGHHLQLALQQELGDLPKFRQNSGFTVFVEGWALYSEWLALEMGFYQDPYSNFGRLSYEMWRALRLVVDTGIHSMGWTREQAINFMAENSALTLLNIRNEVDRYIFWPGQALAYKTGEIKIRELRRRAEAELGHDFNIRDFHDAVLENGSITLEVLEEHILEWIEKNKKQN